MVRTHGIQAKAFKERADNFNLYFTYQNQNTATVWNQHDKENKTVMLKVTKSIIFRCKCFQIFCSEDLRAKYLNLQMKNFLSLC
jgi:hypothetical protein